MMLMRLFVAMVFVANCASAAEFGLHQMRGEYWNLGLDSGYQAAHISLYGPIEAGDHSRFLKTLEEAKAKKLIVTGIRLDSPGGVVTEAIEIGRSVRKNLIFSNAPVFEVELDGDTPLATYYRCSGRNAVDRRSGLQFNKNAVVDNNCTCASACALIYFSGVSRWGDVWLHRSFISGAPEDMSFEDYESKLAASHQSIRDYLAEMRAPEWVTTGLMATPSDDLVLLRDLPNYEPKSTVSDPLFEEYVLSRCPSLVTASEQDFIDWVLDQEAPSWSDFNKLTELFKELRQRKENPPDCTAKLHRQAQQAAQTK
jgi:hypothetical protein